MAVQNDMEMAGARRGHSTRDKESKRSRVRPTEDEDEPKAHEETQAPPAGWWKTFNWREGRACEVFSQDDWWLANVRRSEDSKVCAAVTEECHNEFLTEILQVLVRYVGGTADDDEWIPIDRYSRE